MIMKQKIFQLAAVAALVIFASGCSSIDAQKWNLFSGSSKGTEEAEKDGVKKVGEKLIQAFISNNPEQFLQELPKEASDEFGVNGFKSTRKGMIKELGEPVSYEYLTNLKHPKYDISIWIVRFERDKSDKSEVIQQETLFRAISVTKDGKDVLLDFRFQ